MSTELEANPLKLQLPILSGELFIGRAAVTEQDLMSLLRKESRRPPSGSSGSDDSVFHHLIFSVTSPQIARSIATI